MIPAHRRPLSYPIGMALPVGSGARLILFDAYPSEGVVYRKIWGREVFLVDNLNQPVWQIDPEPGASDDLHRGFDPRRPATECFSSINLIDGSFYASRIGGDTFRIDMDTGLAVYSGWSKT